MDFSSETRRPSVVPAIVAAVIAIVGTAALVLFELIPTNDVQQGISMVTSASAERAGAIVLPTDPAVLNEKMRFAR